MRTCQRVVGRERSALDGTEQGRTHAIRLGQVGLHVEALNPERHGFRWVEFPGQVETVDSHRRREHAENAATVGVR